MTAMVAQPRLDVAAGGGAWSVLVISPSDGVVHRPVTDELVVPTGRVWGGEPTTTTVRIIRAGCRPVTTTASAEPPVVVRGGLVSAGWADHLGMRACARVGCWPQETTEVDQ